MLMFHCRRHKDIDSFKAYHVLKGFGRLYRVVCLKQASERERKGPGTECYNVRKFSIHDLPGIALQQVLYQKAFSQLY
jgi:hypothetical protein